MRGLDQIREATAEFLRKKGIPAVAAWDAGDRVRRKTPVVAVSLRGVQGGPAGLQDYLGEEFDPATRTWEERYGRRAALTLGLDIYAPEELGEAGCAAAFARLAEAFAGDGPEGLGVRELTCGETGFLDGAGLLRCPVQAVCQVFLYAKREENGTFTDFRVRGIHHDHENHQP